MRNRFFFIILATLILGAAGINWIEIYFFQHQRIELIDQQINKSAQALLSSSDIKKAVELHSNLEEAISKAIGSDRIGKVFLLKDASGKLLYQSMNMSVLQTDLPTSPEWVTIQAKDQYVRIFNAPIGRNRILQVGLVLDHNFVHWSIVNQDTIIFIVALILIVFVVAVVLTIVLLAPIRILNAHLAGATSDLSNLKDVDPLPGNLVNYSHGFWARSDEFAHLVGTVEKLIGRINQNYKLTRSWTLQMAHELKTPLAIVRAETETGRNTGVVPAPFAERIISEVDRTSEIVTQFLSWAEIENSHPQRTLHILRTGSVVRNACDRLSGLFGRPIRVEIQSDFSVAASPAHFDQMVTNLIGNACKFSDASSEVKVIVRDRMLSVIDRGPGLPASVLERMGEPFNIGTTPTMTRFKGNGLGLAWVKAVAKLYDWSVEFDVSSSGTRVNISFPEIP